MSKYDIVDISTKFNKTFKQLLNILDNIVPNNTIVDTIKRKAKVSIDANPLLLLEEGGGYIFQFRDYIKDNRFDDLFLNTENVINDTQKNAFDTISGEVVSEENKNVHKLLMILRDSWSRMNASEKKIIEKNIKTLLSEYCKMISMRTN